MNYVDRPFSVVEDMRNRIKEIEMNVNGDKETNKRLIRMCNGMIDSYYRVLANNTTVIIPDSIRKERGLR